MHSTHITDWSFVHRRQHHSVSLTASNCAAIQSNLQVERPANGRAEPDHRSTQRHGARTVRLSRVSLGARVLVADPAVLARRACGSQLVRSDLSDRACNAAFMLLVRSVFSTALSKFSATWRTKIGATFNTNTWPHPHGTNTYVGACSLLRILPKT